MKIVVISSPDTPKGEINTIGELIENGLETFHLRKPTFSEPELEEYLNILPESYHKHIVIHSHHVLAKKFKLKGIHITRKHRKKSFKYWWFLMHLKLSQPNLVISCSFHSITSVLGNEGNFNYVFLSPIFKSISKEGYEGNFDSRHLTSALRKSKQEIFALGGVSSENIRMAHKMGFNGVALLGAIWNDDRNPIKEYIESRKICDELVTPYEFNISYQE